MTAARFEPAVADRLTGFRLLAFISADARNRNAALAAVIPETEGHPGPIDWTIVERGRGLVLVHDPKTDAL